MMNIVWYKKIHVDIAKRFCILYMFGNHILKLSGNLILDSFVSIMNIGL